MTSPLRSAVLGGAAVLVLSMAAAVAAAQTSTSTTVTGDGVKTERHVVIMRSGPDGKVTHYDSADGGPMPEMPGMMMRMHRPDPEREAKHLREVLQLTPQQEPALQAFLGSMKPPEHGHDGEHGRALHPPMPTDPAARKAEMEKRMGEMKGHLAEMEKKRADEAAMTTPQKLDMMVKHMAEESAKHQAALQAHVDAVKRFYGALTASQQKAFDALHGPGMGGFMHGGGMGFGHGDGDMRFQVHRFGALAPMPPMPPMPPLPPLAARAPLPPLPPLPPAPPAPPPPPPGDR